MATHRAARTRQQAGRYAQAKGQSFEDEIKRVNDSLLSRRLGSVVHCHAATKQRSGHVLWQARGPFDWVGLLEGGISVFFESKEKDFIQNSMPTRSTLPERDEHQLIALRNFARFSSDRVFCFVLFNWRLLNGDGEIVSAEMRLHPIQTVPERTILRQRGVLCPNRNWYDGLMSRAYKDAAMGAFVEYSREEDIPI